MTKNAAIQAVREHTKMVIARAGELFDGAGHPPAEVASMKADYLYGTEYDKGALEFITPEESLAVIITHVGEWQRKPYAVEDLVQEIRDAVLASGRSV